MFLSCLGHFTIAIAVLLVSCSGEQLWQKISSKNYQSVSSNGQPCSSGCTGNTTCDYQYYIGTNPTCRPICTTPGQTGGSCSSDEICNPITATCEPSCNSTSDCNNFFGAPNLGTCSSTSNGYCKVTCTDNSQCSTFGTNLKCNTGTGSCSQTCTDSSTCPGGQQCLSSICQFPPCSNSTDCSPSSLYQCFSKTFCVPQSCGTGPWCGEQGFCNNDSKCSCGSGSVCTAPEICSASGDSGQCLCNGSPCLDGETCVTNGTTTQCQCGTTTAGLTCGNGTCNASGFCVCGTTTCTTGQTCSPTGTCETPSMCGNSPCSGACVDNTCLSSITNGDGTCTTPCPAGQLCFSNQCLSVCGTSNNYCLPSETCSNGQCLCGTKTCGLQQICANGTCIKSQCGDGFINAAQNETCDEGDGSKYSGPGCPNGWTHNSSNNKCTPTTTSAGNGSNGHCATDCSAPCVLQYTTPATISNYWPASQLITALGNLVPIPTSNCQPACSSGYNCQNTVCVPNTANSCSATTPCPVGQSCSSGNCVIDSWTNNPAKTTAQCPNGLGIWVLNDSYTPTSMISIPNSVAVYGGFNGTERSPADRVANNLGVPLGQDAFSGTVLQGNGAPIIEIGGGASSSSSSPLPNISVILDGFQILNGAGSESKIVNDQCENSSSKTAPSLAGGITICKNATATLQNLRIFGNKTGASGGGIRNLGTMTLKDSMVSMNTAQTAGGGISHESTSTSTIERVTFFGNGIVAIGSPSVCPSGYVCSLSTPPATCTVIPGQTTPTPPTPTGTTCPIGYTYTPTPTPATCVLNSSCTFANGGAIASTNSGALNVYASKFNSNYSYWDGGAIYSNGVLHSVSSLFAGNWASYAGGGLYLGGGGQSNQLYNLTFIDNSAYTLGGGGIYDEGTSSKLQNSLFRDNKGLYPVNSSTAAEWVGNRAFLDPSKNNTPTSYMPIGSINQGVTSATSNNSLLGSYIDICPTIAYTYDTGICPGVGPLCGHAATAISGSGINLTYNVNATNNQCHVEQEFLDCVSPTYRNCSPVLAKQKKIQGSSASSYAGASDYKFDLAGNPFPSSGTILQGAYQEMVCSKENRFVFGTAKAYQPGTPYQPGNTSFASTTDADAICNAEWQAWGESNSSPAGWSADKRFMAVLTSSGNSLYNRLSPYLLCTNRMIVDANSQTSTWTSFGTSVAAPCKTTWGCPFDWNGFNMTRIPPGENREYWTGAENTFKSFYDASDPYSNCDNWGDVYGTAGVANYDINHNSNWGSYLSASSCSSILNALICIERD